MAYRLTEGQPYPLGATWDGSGVNFALFSANATRVQLCLFDDKGRREIARIDLPEFTHEVWHGYLPEIRPGQLYGYRVYGPYAPEEGHRFNHHKLLIDPYALALSGDIRWHDACFGYKVDSKRADLQIDRRDSARLVPKCIVVDPAHTWGRDVPPRRRWDETIIYEAHVKGMTELRGDLPPQIRGTFAGLADPKVIRHLTRLGVTAIELQPVQSFFDDRYLVEKGLVNYWGYNTICFHALANRYISPGHDASEFKLMVKRLHEAGIEVIMDVVYNHTAEGNELGPTLSFRGIDNASYYILAEDRRYYFETTGCGNTMNLRHPRVLQMVMDSLRYFVEQCHVDGFRFDLATSLGRDYENFEPNSHFFDAIRQDPVLRSVKLIAEPWDVGQNGHQLGNFPPGWAEWNDGFRDTVRSYWRGDSGYQPALAESLLGSAPRFDHRGRRTWASVNFITAHDGFTLRDLWSFNERHNELNQEDNNDGHDDNRSWNCGVEGSTDNVEINALRDKLRRACLATLLLSHGTPMILMGDECGRTQQGNNNAYCQDDETSWLDWSSGTDTGLFEFIRGLIFLRKSRPLLRSAKFRHGKPIGKSGLPDVVWLKPDSQPMTADDWQQGDSDWLGLMLSEADQRSLLMVFNPSEDQLIFKLPTRQGDVTWRLLIDSGNGDLFPNNGPRRSGDEFSVEPRSVFLFETAEVLN